MNESTSALEIYWAIMQETKIRFRSIKKTISGLDKSTEKWWLDVEFSCLQVRRIIENIVFASTLKECARYRRLREKEGSEKSRDHGDAEKDWNTNIIIKKLVKLSPHALPIPIQWPPKRDGHLLHFDRKTLAVNHSRLIEIYEKSSALMHTMNPIKLDYSTALKERHLKYEISEKDIMKDIDFLKQLLWTHATIQLEWTDKDDPLSPDQPKSAWIVRFGKEDDNEIRIAVSEAIN